MRRRSFLKSAAAVLPAVGLQGFALSEAAAQSASPVELHPVGAGEDRFGETHSLGFSTILFKVVPRETNGGLLVIEHKNLMKGGPPVHFHLHQDEWFYVMEGEVVFQVGDMRRRLGAGESMLGPRMVPHGFVGVGEKPAHMIIAFTPAGMMEAFFRAAAVPNGPKMDAELFSRYDRFVANLLKVFGERFLASSSFDCSCRDSGAASSRSAMPNRSWRRSAIMISEALGPLPRSLIGLNLGRTDSAVDWFSGLAISVAYVRFHFKLTTGR